MNIVRFNPNSDNYVEFVATRKTINYFRDETGPVLVETNDLDIIDAINKARKLEKEFNSSEGV